MTLTPAERRVKRLEKKFRQANEDLRQFEDDNSDVMDELRKLALYREAALKELETAVRETRMNAAGMQVTVIQRRDFDGEALYRHFENDPGTRDKLVKVKYQVVSQEFDSMFRQGLITGKLADKMILDVKETVRVDHKPKNFQLG